MNIQVLLFALTCLVPVVPVVPVDHWPQWRGPNFDSRSNESNLPSALDRTHRLWRFEMPGPGGSSPIVWSDQIFVATVEGQNLALLCVSVEGELIWKKTLAGANQPIRMDSANSASPSPVTDGQHVWVMLTDGILHCFTMEGELRWTKDMQADYGKFEIQFGMASTPVLDNGRLYFQFIHGNMRNDQPSIGKVVALQADNGREVWVHTRRTPAVSENKHAYTSPIIFRDEQRQYLVIHGADYATGHALDDGQELWRVGGFNPVSSYNNFLRFVASPAVGKSLLIIPSAKGGPVLALSPKLKGTVTSHDAAVLWTLDRGTPDVATPVISGERVYLARENGVLICLDAATGQKLFEERILSDRHRSTPVVADGKVYLVGRDGTAIVVADQNAYKLISQSELQEETTASPAVSNGRVYIRTNESLMAFGLK